MTQLLANEPNALKAKISEVAKFPIHEDRSEEKPTEGKLTKSIENQTARIPSVGYLGLAIGSMALSAILAVSARRKEYANFVGLWVPSLLLIGVYNKLVKLQFEAPRPAR